jgi:hypothetical protein
MLDMDRSCVRLQVLAVALLVALLVSIPVQPCGRLARMQLKARCRQTVPRWSSWRTMCRAAFHGRLRAYARTLPEAVDAKPGDDHHAPHYEMKL